MSKIAQSVRRMDLDINTLHTDLYFQEVPNKTRIEQIASTWDWKLVNTLSVSFRDGQYYVVDGQHRLFALKKRFGNSNRITTVPCSVVEGLDKAEEMEWFVKLATEKRKVKVMELYKAQYGAGNKSIVEMVDAINESGFIFDFKESKGKNRITPIKTIYKVYIKLGKENFKKYLQLIKNTWDGDKVSLQRDILVGMYEFFVLYKDEFNEQTFIKKLGKYSPEDIVREGKSDLLDKTSIGCAKSIFNKYNKALKEQNRLNIKW